MEYLEPFFKVYLGKMRMQQWKKKRHIFSILLLKIILLMMEISEVVLFVLFGSCKKQVMILKTKLALKP